MADDSEREFKNYVNMMSDILKKVEQTHILIPDNLEFINNFKKTIESLTREHIFKEMNDLYRVTQNLSNLINDKN